MNDERHDLAILYVLDLLNDAQRRELEREMRTDAQLTSEIHSLNDVASALARAVPQVAPPVGLRERILAETAVLPQESVADAKITAFPPTKSSRNPMLWLAAAAVLMLAGLAIWNGLRDPGLIPEVPPVVEVAPVPVPMEGQTDAYSDVKARVAWNPQTRGGQIEAESLPALPEGRTYQIWILDPGHESPLPAGIFDHPQDGPATAAYQSDAATGDTVRIAVSIEPAGGSAQPTGPVVLVSAEIGG